MMMSSSLLLRPPLATPLLLLHARPYGGRDTFVKTKTAAEIVADEQRGIFRKLDLGVPKPQVWQEDAPKFAGGRRRRIMPMQDRADIMSPYQDWESVWPGPRTFHPSVVPLPIRQGYIHLSEQVYPTKKANVELMKIPNFLHATPPVIRKQCNLLREWCTEWPKGDVEKTFPVEVTTSTYLNSSSSIRDHRSRKVTLSFPLDALSRRHPTLNTDKFRRLIGPARYNESEDIVTISADCCPHRAQNEDYVNYLMTAVFHESCRSEAWEDGTKTEADMVSFDYGLRDGGVETSEEHTSVLKELMEKGESGERLDGYKEAVRRLYKVEKFEASA